jgi:hypothetical protein
VLDDLPSPTSTNVKFYVDGQLDTVVGGAFVGINTVALNQVLIGTDIQNRFFKGMIDEVRIYNHALSAVEIIALHNATNDSALAWHRRYFGNQIINWNADDDGDGVTRLGEYAFGGQPHISDSQVTQIVPQIVADHLQVRFNRRISGTSELVYQVQKSTNLTDWIPLAGTVISATPSTPGFEEVIFQAGTAVSTESPVFVRVALQAF